MLPHMKHPPTPLRIAAVQGDLESMNALLDNGAEIDEAPNNSFTPLACAAASGQMEAVELLIRRGANVNASGGVGRHVLLMATWREAERGDKGVVRALLDAGADINLTSCYGGTALQGACGFPRGIGTLRLLLSRGGDVNIANRHGWTPLMMAAREGLTDQVSALLAYEPNLLAKDKNGQTAMMLAVQNEHTDVVALLFEAGAEE